MTQLSCRTLSIPLALCNTLQPAILALFPLGSTTTPTTITAKKRKKKRRRKRTKRRKQRPPSLLPVRVARQLLTDHFAIDLLLRSPGASQQVVRCPSPAQPPPSTLCRHAIDQAASTPPTHFIPRGSSAGLSAAAVLSCSSPAMIYCIITRADSGY